MPETPQTSAYTRAVDYANRVNPFEIYAEMRETPVSKEADGTFVVSTYHEVRSLFHDPRISSDIKTRSVPELGEGAGATSPKDQAQGENSEEEAPEPRNLSDLDPPKHDILRRLAMRQFGPPNHPRFVYNMQSFLSKIANKLIDDFGDKREIDLVHEYAYPFPVEVICMLLGVPEEDKPQVEKWSEMLSNPGSLDEIKATSAKAFKLMGNYMRELIEKHRQNPGDDMLSALIHDEGDDAPMEFDDLVATSSLLLSAGHETTVNLIGNGMLMLLRHPDLADRLKSEPDYAIGFVEELLRCESPVQFLFQRSAMADIEIAGVSIPKGSPVLLMLGAANRDPQRFPDAEKFDAERKDNQHLGFGSGVHNCFGAPLARLEGQIAFKTLFDRLINPTLITDPPPYRKNPMVRGLSELIVRFDGIREASESIQ
jgi:cytochrome P450